MPADTLQTLKKAFSLLDCFSHQQPELGVREIARMNNLPHSTAGRLLTSLKEIGVLRQNPQTKNYTLGGRVLSWAEVYSATMDVRNVAMPSLEQLHKDINETVSLYVLEGDERVCVGRLESEQNVRIVQRIGRRLPLYAGSAGKVFLAFLPAGRREDILDRTSWDRLTPNTITDRDELMKELEKIREQGYGVSLGEWMQEASGVAAPIFNQNGQICAVVSLSGPSQRFSEQMISKYITEITHVAEKISHDLGYFRRLF